MRTAYTLLICQILFYFALASSCFAGAEAFATWSAPDGSEINVFYSTFHETHWAPPTRITDKGTNVTPAITAGGDGIIWILWVEFTKENRILKYARIHGNDIAYGRVSGAPLERSYAPSIIVDRANNPWVVWAGFIGTDEDIFFSRWKGTSWEAPQQVNMDNNQPDITPTIGLGLNGQPWVSWLSFNGSEYDTHVTHWSKTCWGTAERVRGKSYIHQKIGSVKSRIPQMPTQAANRLMGSVFMPNSSEVQSVSDRILTLDESK